MLGLTIVIKGQGYHQTIFRRTSVQGKGILEQKGKCLLFLAHSIGQFLKLTSRRQPCFHFEIAFRKLFVKVWQLTCINKIQFTGSAFNVCIESPFTMSFEQK